MKWHCSLSYGVESVNTEKYAFFFSSSGAFFSFFVRLKEERWFHPGYVIRASVDSMVLSIDFRVKTVQVALNKTLTSLIRGGTVKYKYQLYLMPLC